jgi:hypothetical protein
MKKILIKNCNDCPFRGIVHNSVVDRCYHGFGHRITNLQNDPDCPLEDDLPESKETNFIPDGVLDTHQNRVYLVSECDKEMVSNFPNRYKYVLFSDQIKERKVRETEKCPNCGGTGSIKNGQYTEDCMKCGGSGQVEVD